jgi:hypothetical protein
MFAERPAIAGCASRANQSAADSRRALNITVKVIATGLKLPEGVRTSGSDYFKDFEH